VIFDLLLNPLLQVVRIVLLPSIASADFEANCRTIDSPRWLVRPTGEKKAR